MTIVLKDASDANVTYNIYRKESDRAEYIGPVHTDLSKDLLVVSSASPKQTSGSFGNRRSSANYLKTVTVADPAGVNVSRDLKVEIIVSMPAGVPFATLKESLRRIATAASTDDIATDLFHIGRVDR
nr:MAG: hypothetical protein 2 [Leviviridae sp.]